MEGDRNTFAHVTATLPSEREACLLQNSDDLAGGETRQARHHTATSTVDNDATELNSGISSPLAMRS